MKNDQAWKLTFMKIFRSLDMLVIGFFVIVRWSSIESFLGPRDINDIWLIFFPVTWFWCSFTLLISIIFTKPLHPSFYLYIISAIIQMAIPFGLLISPVIALFIAAGTGWLMFVTIPLFYLLIVFAISSWYSIYFLLSIADVMYRFFVKPQPSMAVLKK